MVQLVQVRKRRFRDLGNNGNGKEYSVTKRERVEGFPLLLQRGEKVEGENYAKKPAQSNGKGCLGRSLGGKNKMYHLRTIGNGKERRR